MRIFLVEDSSLLRVLLDIPLAEGSGFDVLNGVHVAAPEIDFCMLSALHEVIARRVAARR